MNINERRFRLTLHKLTGTIVYFVTDFGKQTISPTCFQSDLSEAVHWGLYEKAFAYETCTQFRYDKTEKAVFRWEPGRLDTKTVDQCILLREKCRSMHELHRRVVLRRLDITKMMTQDQIYERKVAEAERYLGAFTGYKAYHGIEPSVDELNIKDFPYLGMAAHYAGKTDYAAVAKHILIKHDEYEKILLHTEDHRMAWTKAIREAKSVAEVKKVEETIKATIFLGTEN